MVSLVTVTDYESGLEKCVVICHEYAAATSPTSDSGHGGDEPELSGRWISSPEADLPGPSCQLDSSPSGHGSPARPSSPQPSEKANNALFALLDKIKSWIQKRFFRHGAESSRDFSEVNHVVVSRRHRLASSASSSSVGSLPPEFNDVRHAKERLKLADWRYMTGNITSTVSCPAAKMKQQHSAITAESQLQLSLTWPLLGVFKTDTDSLWGDETVTLNSWTGQQTMDSTGRDSVCDCSVPLSELEFTEPLRERQHHTVHRGRWYGEVHIHTFLGEEHEPAVDILTLSQVRHENVALFMGAGVDGETLAIILSIQTRLSLYEQIHMKPQRLSVPSALAICRQVAQGLCYLHSRNMVLKHLSSRNIFLDGRVKISLLDCGFAENNSLISMQPHHGETAVLPRGALSYLAPELLKHVEVEGGRAVYRKGHDAARERLEVVPETQDSDVFAFGTLLYEVICGEFPWRDLTPHQLMYLIATGKRCSLTHDQLRFVPGVKHLIRDCWCHDSLSRPVMKEVYSRIVELNGVPNGKKHSSSEPERLHKMGMGNNRGGYLFF